MVTRRIRPAVPARAVIDEQPDLVDCAAFAWRGRPRCSVLGGCITCAVFHDGRWGVVYECAGEQILSAWVDERDLPLHELVEALNEAQR